MGSLPYAAVQNPKRREGGDSVPTLETVVELITAGYRDGEAARITTPTSITVVEEKPVQINYQE